MCISNQNYLSIKLGQLNVSLSYKYFVKMIFGSFYQEK